MDGDKCNRAVRLTQRYRLTAREIAEIVAINRYLLATFDSAYRAPRAVVLVAAPIARRTFLDRVGRVVPCLLYEVRYVQR